MIFAECKWRRFMGAVLFKGPGDVWDGFTRIREEIASVLGE